MAILHTRTNLSALNAQQLKAVLSENKRLLVLAGAGSGKTNTLLQKINYLLDDKQVEASSILAITFTKNAANEMIDRMIIAGDKTGYYKQVLDNTGANSLVISELRREYINKSTWLKELSISTFHSLCYSILKKDGVHIFDNKFKIVPKQHEKSDFSKYSASETEAEILEKVIIQLCNSPEYIANLKRYVLDYMVDGITDGEENEEHRPEGKFFTTLNKDKVRSKSEQFIADWFFRNNIKYIYEPPFQSHQGVFHPDFFLPEANIYLEHVSDLSHPTFWKEVQMAKVDAVCIKTFDKATHNSAVFNQVLNNVIKGRISKELDLETSLNYYEEFQNFRKEMRDLIRQILDIKGAISTSGKDIVSVKKESEQSQHERVRLFYKVAIPALSAYRSYCYDRSYIDFDGLLQFAFNLLEERKDVRDRYRKKYKYILVDEFQDVNSLQVDLLKQLLGEETQLFCVGDDWQSIYGFRGSEVGFIVDFQNHFHQSEIIKLDLNYRSTDFIVDASTEVIKKNKNQLQKEIRAVRKGGQKIVVHYSEHEGHEEAFIWEAIQKHLKEGYSSEDILILYRRTAMSVDLKQALTKSGIHVGYKTIHSSKGLEAKIVFILGLHSGAGGFPDPWMHDKIYHVIKETNFDFLMEEERRLFYVAMTRAKDHLYLISRKGAVSEFVKDIPKNMLSAEQEKVNAMDHPLLLCSNCQCLLEKHFHFCPYCGTEINDNLEQVSPLFNEDILISRINNIPLIHPNDRDNLIFNARRHHRRAYEPWQDEEDDLLLRLKDHCTLEYLSRVFGRSTGGISMRIQQLEGPRVVD